MNVSSHAVTTRPAAYNTFMSGGLVKASLDPQGPLSLPLKEGGREIVTLRQSGIRATFV
jgi:hypothetical protein